MNKDKILKAYLVHFIYVPAAIIYSLVVGEDMSVLILIFFLSLLAAGVAFGFNYLITLLGLNLFKSRILMAFILPTLVALLLYVPINSGLQYLDFGGNNAYIIFILVSSIVNLGAFMILRSKKLRMKN